MVRRRVIVSGVVQGVGFRWWTRTQARRLGLVGWVRNRRDGTVEAELEGERAAVDEMLARLRSGPDGAEVSAVEATDIAEAGGSGFELRR
ncbi:acylphosphatase [Microbacteriaceae bacterium VKM Ac-2854]|nr:acylphosphatase [Microbacteriaceae bacterium VKM Ac-2854]